jgi:hypothetical protein
MPYYHSEDNDYHHNEEEGFWSGVMDRLLKDNEEEITTYYGAGDPYADAYGYGGDEKKKEKSPVPLDYSVLSVAILTLGLILFVEISRHYIDHASHGRPFFKAVLLMVYSECTDYVSKLISFGVCVCLLNVQNVVTHVVILFFFLIYFPTSCSGYSWYC